MLFYSFFKTLINKEVVVELKNDVMISGTLSAVDQFLNIKLENVVVNEEKCPRRRLNEGFRFCVPRFDGRPGNKRGGPLDPAVG